ncbi:MAG: DUF2069 domain-containing protein [Pseudoxanthomonas sp.]
MSMSRRILVSTLLTLAALYALWLHDDRHLLASGLVFVAPPLLLAIATLFGAKRAPFWAGVLALAWFCHGVMAAWSRPAETGFALGAVALSLLAVLASNWPGLRARFGKRSHKS